MENGENFYELYIEYLHEMWVCQTHESGTAQPLRMGNMGEETADWFIRRIKQAKQYTNI